MKIADYKCKCGSDDFFLGTSLNDTDGMHVGIYCNKCGKWLKWANKNERNLLIKSVLNEAYGKKVRV